jgi:GTPase SAR1 family protein
MNIALLGQEVTAFDMAHIRRNSSCLIIGKRDSGKTFLIRDILKNLRDMTIGYIVCPITADKNMYRTHTPTVFVHSAEQVSDATPAFIVFDDCILTTHARLLIRRRYLTSIVSTSTRVNMDLDYVFIFAEQVTVTRRQLYECYMSTITSFMHFNRIMDTIAPYECLVIDNVTESLYLYKAPHAS